MCCKWNIYRSTIVPKKLSSPEKFVVALMNNNKKICFSFFFWKICACQVFPLCVVNEIFIVIPLFQKSSPAQKNLWLRSWTITRKFASVFFFWKIFTCQVFPLCVVNEIFIVVPLFQKSSPAQKNLWLHSWTITKRIFASVFLACWLLAY